MDSVEIDMRRLRWRCRRGMRELDAAMLAFLDNHYKDAVDEDRQRFAALLELQDPVIFRLLNNSPDEISQHPEFASILSRIRDSLGA